MTRKVIEAGTAETVGLRAKHESAGPATRDAPNTMADLRLAYARIIREAITSANNERLAFGIADEPEIARKAAEQIIGLEVMPGQRDFAHQIAVLVNQGAIEGLTTEAVELLGQADAIVALPNPTAYARIREALEQHDAAIEPCPYTKANSPSSEAACRSCGAEASEPCRKRVIADANFVDAAREALKATPLIGLEGDQTDAGASLNTGRGIPPGFPIGNLIQGASYGD